MSANTSPIYPVAPLAAAVSLANVSACSTRAPTPTASLAGANIFLLVPTSTNGVRIDKIQITACSSSITAATVAQDVTLWLWDGTTAWPIDEVQVTAVTPSTTSPPFSTSKTYANLVLQSTQALYVSTTIATTSSTTALCVQAFGGSY